jgi:5-methylcytosine-specific restriction endonuclease McrA
MQNYVFVIDQNKQPLSPIPPARARKLLTKQKAAVFRMFPFTVILKHAVPTPAPKPLTIKLDPGSKVTGVAVLDGERKCAYCDKEGVPLQIEHIHPRAKGGSNRVSNLTLSCERCNLKKGTKSIDEFLKKDGSRLEKIKRQAKQPLKDAAAVNATRWALFRTLKNILPTTTGTGGQTKYNRTRLELRGEGKDKAGAHGMSYSIVDQSQSISKPALSPSQYALRGSSTYQNGAGLKQSDLFVGFHSDWKIKSSLNISGEESNQHIEKAQKAGLDFLRHVPSKSRYSIEACPILEGTNALPKQHWVDAACIGEVEKLNLLTQQPLRIKCTGWGTRQMCGTNKYGFPIRHRERKQVHFSFRTGDIIKAVVTSGKKVGEYVGRVLCRKTGSFDIVTSNDRVAGISYKFCIPIHKKDGYSYVF